MPTDKPYSLDFFQTITDVHFGSVAVDFLKRSNPLSQLTFRDGPDLTHGTVATWFRAPRTSTDAARAKWRRDLAIWIDGGPEPPAMSGIVPVVIFGPRNIRNRIYDPHFSDPIDITTKNWEWNQGTCAWVNTFTNVNPVELLSFINPHDDENSIIDPSFIGIDCRTDRNILSFNFQFSEGTGADVYKGTEFVTVGVDVPPYDRYGTAGLSGAAPCLPAVFVNPDGSLYPAPSVGGLYTRSTTEEPRDFSGTNAVAPRFGTVGAKGSAGFVEGRYVGSDPYYGGGKDVTPDHWHQLTLSFDLRADVASKGVFAPFGGGDHSPYNRVLGTYSSAVTFRAALDDVDLAGKQISLYTVDRNKFLTEAGYSVYRFLLDTDNLSSFEADTGDGHSRQSDTFGAIQAQYLFRTPALPIGTIVIPGDDTSPYRIELAEMYIYEPAANTSLTGTRRLFVSDKGKWVDPKRAEKVLGKPLFKLHGTSDWEAAKDTGVLQLSGRADGDIEAYHPDPNLRGPQGE